MVIEEATDGQAVRAFLLVRPEHKGARVGFLREKLQARLAAGLERADAVVLARQLVALALLHHAEVRHEVLQHLAALAAVEHQAHLPVVLHELRRALHERALAERRLGLLEIMFTVTNHQGGSLMVESIVGESGATGAA